MWFIKQFLKFEKFLAYQKKVQNGIINANVSTHAFFILIQRQVTLLLKVF